MKNLFLKTFEKDKCGDYSRHVYFTVIFYTFFFNMAWLWYLGRQIEQRAGSVRMLLMILVVGIIANVAQYLMSGPYFLGFSGVVVGMVGFIWVRQRVAPWEGYPLPRGVLCSSSFFLWVQCLLSNGSLSFCSCLQSQISLLTLPTRRILSVAWLEWPSGKFLLFKESLHEYLRHYHFRMLKPTANTLAQPWSLFLALE